jgi:glutamine amidotransferase
MLKKIGTPSIVSGSVDVIQRADKLILPGVGAFDNGMKNISEMGLLPVLNDQVLEKGTPILGICLGMQLLTDKSEEGSLPGLGWIEGRTVRFSFDSQRKDLKIPHMGWNTVKVRKQGSLFTGMEDTPRFYFVHSYHVTCNRQEDVLGTTEHGYEFSSAISRGNILGTQFHPEKSHRFGMTLLRNFVERI